MYSWEVETTPIHFGQREIQVRSDFMTHQDEGVLGCVCNEPLANRRDGGAGAVTCYTGLLCAARSHRFNHVLQCLEDHVQNCLLQQARPPVEHCSYLLPMTSN